MSGKAVAPHASDVKEIVFEERFQLEASTSQILDSTGEWSS